METAEENAGGVLLDPSDPAWRQMQDLALIGKARRLRWNVDPESMPLIAQRVVDFALTSPRADVAIKAAAELRMMVAHDIAEDSRGQPSHVEHHHTHELGPVTESNIEAQRAKRLARLAGSV